MWTKRKLVTQAFDELALAGYDFDLTPSELDAALTRLEARMATWEAQGLRIGYAFAEDGDIDAPSGLPLVACEAVYLELAVATAASKGKAVPQSTLAGARQAKAALMSWAAHQDTREQQFKDSMPRGAGQKSWRGTQRPFFNAPDTSPIQTSESGGLDILGA